MGSVTHSKFREDSKKAGGILGIVMVVCIYKISKSTTILEYEIIFLCSLICYFGIRRLVYIGEQSFKIAGYKITLLDSIIVGNIIILLLGVLSMYLFFVKGMYGLYKLLGDFSWTMLALRIFAVIFFHQLAYITYRLQTVYKAIERNNITR